MRQEKRLARRAAAGADADTSAIRATPQSALEGAGLADFSDIGPTLELHDELKCLESEAVHLTATVRAALAHARRHAIDVARSLCPPHTTASTGRTPPVDSPIGVALKVVFCRNICRRLGFAYSLPLSSCDALTDSHGRPPRALRDMCGPLRRPWMTSRRACTAR